MFKSTEKKKKLNKLLLLTEKKFSRGPSKEWRNKDFEDLSFTIHIETKILISTGTLKRVFGKTKMPGDYFPQEATIAALENYTGTELFPSVKLNNKRPHKTLYIVSSTVFAVTFTILLFLFVPKHEILPEGAIQIKKIDGKSPATVYFDYNYSQTDDSVFINFGDTDEISPLNQTEGNISHYYRYPGKFTSYLQTRKKSFSNKTNFWVQTNGWQSLAYYYDQPYEERYFPVPIKSNSHDGIFSLSGKNLSSLGMDTTRIVVVRIDNYKETDSSGDSFKLETRLTNNSFWPAIRCYSAYVKIAAEKGDILFKFLNEGCSQFSEYTISEKNKVNNQVDATGFSINMSDWNVINIENNRQQVVVKVNNHEIFRDSYIKPVGKIIGATVLFHGIGSIDYFYLLNSSDQKVFYEEFN